MLLELLKRHKNLLTAVIRPLIGARKAADLARLAASCQQINSFIATIDFYKHSKLFNNSLKNIKTINTINNKSVSILEYNNKLHVYVCDRHQGSFPHKETYIVWSSNDCRRERTIYRGVVIRHDEFVNIYKHYGKSWYLCIDIIGPRPEWINKYIKTHSLFLMPMGDKWTFIGQANS
jgi:hypothetical protein